MGVLDDAIREHLDLKRKHGAPEEELRRQEEEALGPVRREVEPPREETEASGNGEAPEAVLEPAPEQVAEPDPAPFDGEAPSRGAEARGGALESFNDEAASAEPQGAEPVEPVEAIEPVEPVEPEEPEGPEVTEESEPDRFDFHPDRDPERPLEGSHRFERESDRAEDDADLEEEPEQAGDVLEDTPDFLEETPEHDRLWFEQKPPRDFDFD
jgi:hypothetical protein